MNWMTGVAVCGWGKRHQQTSLHVAHHALLGLLALTSENLPSNLTNADLPFIRFIISSEAAVGADQLGSKTYPASVGSASLFLLA
jgi:hypothetical protein